MMDPKEAQKIEAVLSKMDKSRDAVYFDSLSLGGGVTIDTSGNDNGFLACARTGWLNPPGDSTCAQAATNLARYRATAFNLTQLVLVGHGNSGLISTGDGMSPSTTQGYISNGNYAVWQPFFAQLLNHGTLLTLCGCDCGADQAGATFLYQLATLLNRPVRGRTGLVYLSCPGAYVTYENGSVWQVAQPGVMPTPIPKPSHFQLEAQKEIQFESTAPVPFEAVFKVELHDANGRITAVDSVVAKSLAASANLGRKLHIDGALGAVVTGRIVISVEIEGRKMDKTLILYNDRVLQDHEHKYVYYFCSAGFTEEIRGLRTRK
jgi:hypothetical protein